MEVTTNRLSKESDGNSPKSIKSVRSSILFFNVWNIAIFSVCEKVLTESHSDIARNARSKQHISNPNSEADKCIGVYISDCLWHKF